MNAHGLPARWPGSGGWHALRVRLARGWRVPSAFAAQHAALVRARLGVLAPMLVVLTLAWIPLEAYWLGMADLHRLVMPRLVLAGLLAALAVALPRLSVLAAVNTFLWLQALGFGWLQWQVAPVHAEAVLLGYGLFPFVLVAQLALLPLPGWRGSLAGLAPAAQLAAIHWQGGGGASGLNDILLFLLIATVAIWASHAQLRLLVDLLGARSDAAQDALTGLANRRAGDTRLEAERRDAVRRRQPLSVLMLDLDHFKQVNDRWGHAVGDQLLVAVARALRDELRGIDLPVRHGGEEFLCLLPGTDAGAAMHAAERIRARIADLRIVLPGDEFGATASLGVATLVPGESAAALVARADEAMYAAKQAGRDRCLAAPAPSAGAITA